MATRRSHLNGRQDNASNGQAKKLYFKPFKTRVQLPENFEEETWAKLKNAISAVHGKRPVSCSLEDLYRAVEDMCIHKLAERLYKNLQQECDTHIQQQVLSLKAVTSLPTPLFLERVDAVWQDHCRQTLTLRSIFLYLDRTYALSTPATLSLFDMGLHLLRTHIQTHPEVEARLVEGLLTAVEADRRGEGVERVLLKSLLSGLGHLGLYDSSFLPGFLRDTQQYYKAEGERLIGELAVPEYLLHCERRLLEEYERCTGYLEAATRKPLISTVEQQLVAAHIGSALERGFGALVDGCRVEDLARLYQLCGRVAALDALRGAFKDYIRLTGTAIVKDEDKDKEMVERLLELKGRLDGVLEGAFERSDTFSQALREACEGFINTRANKPAELVAKFLDVKLRAGGAKGISDEELEGLLDRTLVLFRFIQGKDVFEAFYKKDLAKRLLLGKSASSDAEKSLISRLKAECGAQFTSKLEGMFKDIDLSREIVTQFRQSSVVRDRMPGGVEMGVHVLTSGYWPSYPPLELRLPEELARYQEVFRDFYLGKHSGRKLVWHNSLASCILKASFPRGVKELAVSLGQAVVLLLFNDAGGALSYVEIKEGTGLADVELKRTLQSLACGKVRVVVKEPKGREVGEGDSFRFNGEFQDRLFRIRINTIQLKESEEENKKTNEQVLQDRQYQIDAALVRIMKTRKALSHRLLISEALQQLKFPLKGSDLKKRIESLIDREYLERDAADPNMYKYLA